MIQELFLKLTILFALSIPSLIDIPRAVEIARPEFAITTLFCELVPLLLKTFMKILADSSIVFPPLIDF